MPGSQCVGVSAWGAVRGIHFLLFTAQEAVRRDSVHGSSCVGVDVREPVRAEVFGLMRAACRHHRCLAGAVPLSSCFPVPCPVPCSHPLPCRSCASSPCLRFPFTLCPAPTLCLADAVPLGQDASDPLPPFPCHSVPCSHPLPCRSCASSPWPSPAPATSTRCASL